MIPNSANYNYPAGVEFFGAQTALIKRLEHHYPNKMAISRLLASGRLKSVGRNGALAFKTSDLDELIAERRREVVSSIMSKGAAERERIVAEITEGHAAAAFRATPREQDRTNAARQVEAMVASATHPRRQGFRADRWNMKLA